jgi:uncharacterized protein (DUF934 family)
MPLIADGKYVEDTWLRIGGEAPLPLEGDVLIDFDRLKEHGAPNREGRLGVQVANNVDVLELAPWLDRLDLIALEFPTFNDGRAFSQGRTLRHTMGFAGELRATGKPLADQGAFLIRCGFTSFEGSGRQPLEVWQAAIASVTRVYQASYARGAGTARE